MKKKRRVVDVVREVAKPLCDNFNIDLVDVQFVKEGPHRFLRIIIDKEEGISLDDCQNISKEINIKLDEIDPIEENYFLEVTSPGVERELKRQEDFEKFKGSQIQVRLFQAINGQKVIVGELLEMKNGIVKVLFEGSEIEIPVDKSAGIKLVADFDE